MGQHHGPIRISTLLVICTKWSNHLYIHSYYSSNSSSSSYCHCHCYYYKYFKLHFVHYAIECLDVQLKAFTSGMPFCIDVIVARLEIFIANLNLKKVRHCKEVCLRALMPCFIIVKAWRLRVGYCLHFIQYIKHICSSKRPRYIWLREQKR